MRYSRITGTGSYLPSKVLTNYDLESKVDTSHDWIVKRTGIEQRHIADDSENVADIGTKAAKNALEYSSIDSSAIDGIIVATCSSSKIFPSAACLIQKELNITNGFAFDVNAACSGFLYALSVADSMIKSGAANNILVIGSEIMSRVLNWEDRKTCVLFGDGAGAMILSSSDTPGIYSTMLKANGRESGCLKINNLQTISSKEDKNPYLEMDGQKVFKNAVTELEKISLEIIKSNNFELKDIDWLVPHQANIRIISHLAKKLKLSDDQIILKVKEHANTSAASIPLAFDYGVRNNKIKKGQNVLLEAIGGGLTWGAALIKY